MLRVVTRWLLCVMQFHHPWISAAHPISVSSSHQSPTRHFQAVRPDAAAGVHGRQRTVDHRYPTLGSRPGDPTRRRPARDVGCVRNRTPQPFALNIEVARHYHPPWPPVANSALASRSRSRQFNVVLGDLEAQSGTTPANACLLRSCEWFLVGSWQCLDGDLETSSCAFDRRSLGRWDGLRC
ncbi:uncharacterized protein B0T15DRAFT_530529 [Chaetomium strumarium]|uniref:Secreted protein n=1 Tax=Chaetomium strumarium TaxID=1170767 RepID=A0AAJ0M3C5_9PEZI|nr:hypothetical protein B0T15DRAFT_530529 [Chaetomium strumarium]